MKILEGLLAERGGGTFNVRLENDRWQVQLVMAATDRTPSSTHAGSGATLAEALDMAGLDLESSPRGSL